MVIRACPPTCPGSSFHKIKDKRNRKIIGETTSYANSPCLFSCYLYSAVRKGDEINPHMGLDSIQVIPISQGSTFISHCVVVKVQRVLKFWGMIYIIEHVLQLDTCVCIAEPLCCPPKTTTKL